MLNRLRDWWVELEPFDKLGAALASWELFSVVGAAALLPFALRGPLAPVLCLISLVNLTVLGAAVVAWFVTLFVGSGRRPESPEQTLQDFIDKQLRRGQSQRLRRNATRR